MGGTSLVSRIRKKERSWQKWQKTKVKETSGGVNINEFRETMIYIF